MLLQKDEERWARPGELQQLRLAFPSVRAALFSRLPAKVPGSPPHVSADDSEWRWAAELVGDELHWIPPSSSRGSAASAPRAARNKAMLFKKTRLVFCLPCFEKQGLFWGLPKQDIKQDIQQDLFF